MKISVLRAGGHAVIRFTPANQSDNTKIGKESMSVIRHTTKTMSNQFPRTMVGGVSLPRMIMGTNWILGYSHRTSTADNMIVQKNCNAAAIKDMACAYLEYGIDASMMPAGTDFKTEAMAKGLADAEDKMNRPITRILTPTLNMDDTPEGRREAEKTIKLCKDLGGKFLLIHHQACEQLVNKNKQTMDRLPDYLQMIREHDMIPGLSAHMPEVIIYSDQNEYDVETYIQIYNCLGFLMQVEIEYIHKVIHSAKKPVMTIKSMAAGRTTPFVGITFSYATIRDCDMVTLGAFSPDEVHQDVEIAMAALDRRPPNIEGRQSPYKSSIMKA